LGKFPLLGDDDGRRPKGDDLDGVKGGGGPAGIGDNGGRTPREGWQIEFISNPRECINIYGTDTITNVKNLKDFLNIFLDFRFGGSHAQNNNNNKRNIFTSTSRSSFTIGR